MREVILDTGRKVGIIDGHTFYTKRIPKHYFIKFKGFGIGVPVIDHLKNRKDIYEIIFEYYGKRGIKKYIIHLGKINKENFRTYKHEDFEEQFIIPLDEMELVE